MKKALEILNQQLRDETLWLDSHEEAIKELEEAMCKPTCEGCKWQNHTIKDIQNNGSWMKYSVFYECTNDKSCKRNTAYRYEPKDK